MKIFITGGSGFIGKHLVKKLGEEKNNKLFLLSKNLADIESWRKEVEDFKPDVAIHLAWEGLPDYSAETSIKNLKYGLDLIKMLAEIGCKRVMSVGSCWEYGEQSGRLKENAVLKPNNAFSAAKNALHQLGGEIAKENNIQFIWVRLFYVYGIGQRETSLIPYLINCAKTGKTPDIKNASAKNDFIYIEDVIEAISMLVKKCKKSGVYNIGSGHLTSIQEIIKMIFNNFGLDYQCKENKICNSSDFYSDISKIKKEVGWKPKVAIKEGIKEMVWSLSNNK